MEGHRSASPVDDEQKRARIKAKGKAWAEDVNAENAWDQLVLSLGMLLSISLKHSCILICLRMAAVFGGIPVFS
jgi:hypothetical protein